MLIYVTGDVHGDLSRFKGRSAKKLKKNDVLIVCGDFGFVWDGSKKEAATLKWLGKRGYEILFVEGTHDNLDLLAQYPLVEYRGGSARQISGRCYQLLRGEIYTIDERTFFTFGGGESPDMDTRVPGETWWENELPSQQELSHGRETLAAHNNQVDFVVTHQPSYTVNNFLELDSDLHHTNQLAAFFDEISQTVEFQRWFFGCCHVDKWIPPRYRALYQEILPIDLQK